MGGGVVSQLEGEVKIPPGCVQISLVTADNLAALT